DTGEQALEIAELLIRSGALDIVAIDSVAALTPKAEIEGEMGDTHVGLQARLMSQALRKLAGTLNRTDTICIFTNQLREKIGVMSGSYFSFGDERLGQGRQNATAFLREHPDVTQQVLAKIQADAGPEQVVSARLLPTAVEAPAAATQQDEPEAEAEAPARPG